MEKRELEGIYHSFAVVVGLGFALFDTPLRTHR